MNTPLRFHPYLRPTIWGSRRLGEVLGKALPAPGPYGEAWEISDHGSHQSVVSTGSDAGRTLRELLLREPAALLANGGRGPFPWLVKFIDAWDWLSVQVHPDDEAAARLCPGESGKAEAWFVLAAQPGSRVFSGLLPGVDEKQFRAALARGVVAECLHSFEPRPGDFLYLPGRTVHAVGGGVLFAEVQQTSDATFRLFDWNREGEAGRSRKLHVEESLSCIDWNAGPVQPVRACGYPPAPNQAPTEAPVRQRLVECPYFLLDYVSQNKPFALSPGRMQALIVLHGRGVLLGNDGPEPLNAGDTLLLPAALAPMECAPHGTIGLLLATLPGAVRSPY